MNRLKQFLNSLTRADKNFGCAQCWPWIAAKAWNARKKLILEYEVIDESHFHVMILACKHCSQRFVSVFSEEMDLIDGEDPQYWVLLPITTNEVGQLKHPKVKEAALYRLGKERRSLSHDWPKGEKKHSYWGYGIPFRRHD